MIRILWVVCGLAAFSFVGMLSGAFFADIIVERISADELKQMGLLILAASAGATIGFVGFLRLHFFLRHSVAWG